MLTFLLLSRQVGTCTLLWLGLRVGLQLGLRWLLGGRLHRALMGLLAGVTAAHSGVMGAPCCLPWAWTRDGLTSLCDNKKVSGAVSDQQSCLGAVSNCMSAAAMQKI